MVVENISGASGNIAGDRAAKSPPDGYTLLMGGNALADHERPSLYDKLPFDPVKDFVPISRIFVAANMLVVHPDVPAKSIAELVALAKAKPGELTYGHTGAGTSQHLAGELFKYDGQDQHPADRLSRLDRGAARPARRAHHDGLHQHRQRRAAGEGRKAARLRGVARASARRWCPSCRPWRSRVIPGYEAVPWFGLMAPAGTPQAIIDQAARRNRQGAGVAGRAQRSLDNQGLDVIGGTPAEFAEVIRDRDSLLGEDDQGGGDQGERVREAAHATSFASR